jgi:hypothetical protein
MHGTENLKLTNRPHNMEQSSDQHRKQLVARQGLCCMDLFNLVSEHRSFEETAPVFRVH